MNKKLPKIYQCTEKIKTNNNESFYSYKENNVKIEKKQDNIKIDNFFKYFNNYVEIVTFDNKIINTKILSKRGERLLLENGTYIEIKNIKSIN